MVGTFFIYSGMGAQWKTMGQHLFNSNELFRRKVEELDSSIKQQTGFSVVEEILKDSESSRLNTPWIAHPVTFAIQIGITSLLKSYGIAPEAVLGHSGGEVAAAYIGGVLTLEDSARLLAAHGEVMRQVQGEGKMLFVALHLHELEELILSHHLNLSIATVNSPTSIVVSGSDDVDKLVIILEKQKVFCQILNTDVAFHSPIVEPALEKLEISLKGISSLPQTISVYSSLHGTLADQNDFNAAYWVKHIRKPVLFAAAIKAALKEGYTRFLEISPHPILQKSLTECFSDAAVTAYPIGTMERDSGSVDDLIRAVVSLEKSGIEINWDNFSEEERSKADALRFNNFSKNSRVFNRVEMLQLISQALLVESSGSIQTADEHTGFFDLGVDSLMSIQIIRHLETEIGMQLPNTILFDHTSVGTLADHLLLLVSGQEKTGADFRQSKADFATNEPIAIIGIGCRLPGGANSPEEFWNLIDNGVMATSEVPITRWDPDVYYDPDPQVPGKTYVKLGGFLVPDQLDKFDAPFFHIPPREARALDPQQRLLLEVAWETMEQANIPVELLKEQYTGVYLGICCDDYKTAHAYSGSLDRIDAYSNSGSVFSSAGGRISYIFDFTGPSLSVDTACSSSLIALHLACQGLRHHECDAAIATGVNVLLVPNHFVYFSKLGALSPDGRSKSFDAAANGYARGEGCGTVLLKRLSDAQRDGDNILALVKGSAIGQDGASSSFTAPSGLAQQRVIRRALADAGLTPTDISYVEAHGTGTPLGDTVEVSGISAAYCEGRNPDDPLLLGSVKANIGHLEGAAGMASLLKVVLSLVHQRIPPQPGLTNLNPHIPWDTIPLKVVTETTPWPVSATPRRAGVSGFGFSGSNAHIILEEAPLSPEQATVVVPSCQLLELSASTPEALRAMASEYSEYLATAEAETADICATAAFGRSRFPEKLAVAGRTNAELAENLQNRVLKGINTAINPKEKGVVFLFTGQGSQYPGMGKGLYHGWPVYREALDLCDRLFLKHLGRSIRELMHGDDAGLLSRTLYTQPAIFSLQYALCALWESFGVVPASSAGHSIGEFAAACRAGVFSLEDAVCLVARRAELMDSIPGGGLMASIPATEEEVAPLVDSMTDRVAIAAINTTQSVVISGQSEAVRQIVAELEQQGKQARYLQVSHPFHSPVMDPILAEFEQAAAAVTTTSASIALVSGLTGASAGSDDFCTPGYWRRQLREPVRFGASLQTLLDQGFTTFVEIGSAPILSGFGKTISSDSGNLWLPSLRSGQDDMMQICGTLCTLVERGLTSARNFYRESGRRHVQLPTYPFQRTSYWTEPFHPPVSAGANIVRSGDPLLGERIDSPALGDGVLFSTTFTPAVPRFLAEHVIYDRVLSPAAAHICMLAAAARQASNDVTAPVVLKNVHFVRPLLVGQEGRTVQVILGAPAAGVRSARIVSRSIGDKSAVWQEHCQGTVSSSVTMPEIEDLDVIKQRCTGSFDPKVYYDAFVAAGYNVGPSYQRIREIMSGTDESLSRLEGVTHPGDPDPGLMDSIVQSGFGASIGAFLQAIEGGERIYIPIGTQEVVFAAPLTSELWCHARSRITGDALESDVRVYSPEGKLLMSVGGFNARRTDRKTIFASEKTAELFYQLSWKEIDQAGGEHGNAHYLVIGDSAEADSVAEAITALGCACTKASSEAALGQASMSSRNGEILTMLFVAPLAAPEAELETLPENLACLSALITAVGEEVALSKNVKLWLVTKGAVSVEGMEINPLQSAFQGIARAAALEYPQIWGGIVDRDDINSVQQMQNLLTFTAAPGDEREVALRGDRLFAPRLVRLPVKEGKPTPGFRSESSYLITGGTGALGLALAESLIGAGVCHICLAGRREPVGETVGRIAEMNSNGATVTFMQADAASAADLERLLTGIATTMPPLAGVFHLAGVLDDAPLSLVNRARLQNSLGAKAAGAWHLHKLCAGLDLDYFVLFSSITAILGNRGQAPYCAANSFLDGLAQLRRSMGLPAHSIAWGPISGGGMAESSETIQRLMERQGFGLIPGNTMFALIEQLLLTDATCSIAIQCDWNRYREAGNLPVGGFLTALVSRDQQHAAQADERSSILKDLQDADSAKRKEMLVKHLQMRAGEVIGVPVTQLEIGTPLVDQGLDSLMAVDLRHEIVKDLGVEITVATLFNIPTLAGLAGYLLDERLGLSAEVAPVAVLPDIVDSARDLLAEMKGLL